MRRLVPCFLLWAAILNAQPDADTDPLLVRIQAKVLESLDRLPDYVCVQTTERAHRASAKEEFKLARYPASASGSD